MESNTERLARLVMMARGDAKWDLSDHDTEAIAWLVGEADGKTAELNTARASEARLREALELVKEIISPHSVAHYHIDTALSGSSGEWLERQLSEAVAAERERAEKAEATWRCFHCGFKTDDAKVAEAHFGDVDEEEPICRSWERMNADEKVGAFQGALQEIASEQEENSQLRSKLEKAEAERDAAMDRTAQLDRQTCSYAITVRNLEAERDGLAVKFDYMAGEFQRHVDYVAQKYNEETADVRAVFGNVMVDLARISAEARRKALMEAANWFRCRQTDDVVKQLEQMAQEADNA